MNSEQTSVEEVEYVDKCPSCGMRFVGVTPDEFREAHAAGDCPQSPIPRLLVFPKEESA